jgi:hypothetical protein
MPQIAPDEIEQQIIGIVSAIPQQAEMNVDKRSHVTRFFHGSSSGADVLRDDAMKERWTGEIVTRLCALGRRLGFHVC